jgi:hypothetical protein
MAKTVESQTQNLFIIIEEFQEKLKDLFWQYPGIDEERMEI